MFGRFVCAVLMLSLCVNVAAKPFVIKVGRVELLSMSFIHSKQSRSFIEIQSLISLVEGQTRAVVFGSIQENIANQPLVRELLDMAYNLSGADDGLILEGVQGNLGQILMRRGGRSILLAQGGNSSEIGISTQEMTDSTASCSSHTFEKVEPDDYGNDLGEQDLFSYFNNLKTIFKSDNFDWFLQSSANPLKMFLSVDIIQLGNSIITNSELLRESPLIINNFRFSSNEAFQIEGNSDLYALRMTEAGRDVYLLRGTLNDNPSSQKLYTGNQLSLEVRSIEGFGSTEGFQELLLEALKENENESCSYSICQETKVEKPSY